MIYLERRPAPALASHVASVWYVCRPAPDAAWEQVLPSGRGQLVINLAHDCCTGLDAAGGLVAQAPALAVGIQDRALRICTRDTEEMVGVVFTPTGLARLLREPAYRFAGSEVPLASCLGPRSVQSVRDRLRETERPAQKLRVLEMFLMQWITRRARVDDQPHPAVCLALDAMARKGGCDRIAELARSAGISERRLRDLFCEVVGVAPKRYSRILRFRAAVTRLHRGEAIAWADLALLCGFSDQSHFCNEFRAFSGVDLTTYSQSQRAWAGHLAV